MAPGGTFRWFARVAARRPGLVTAIGLGLVAEGGRVVWATGRGGAVLLFGHAGATAFDPIADRPLLLVYVAWVTLCGMLLIAFAARGRRARTLRGATSAAVLARGRPSVGGRLRADAASGRPSSPVISRAADRDRG